MVNLGKRRITHGFRRIGYVKEIEIRVKEWSSRLDLIIYAMLRFKISKIFTGWNMREKDDFVTEMALL